MKKILPIILAIPFTSAFIINFYGINIYELPKQAFIAIFIAVFLAFFASIFLSKEKTKLKLHKGILIYIFLWILTLFFSSFFGEAPLKSFYGDYIRQSGAISHFLYILYFLIVLNTLNTKKEIEKFLKTILIIGVLFAIHSILQKFNIFLIFSIQDLENAGFLGRSFSTFGNPNLLGQFLVFPVFISIYFFANSKSKQKIIPGIFLLLLIIGLIFTENRASILAVSVGASAQIFLSKRITKRIKILVSLLIVTILISFIFAFTPSLRSLGSRFYLWEVANKSFIENPILGTGLETFDIAFQKFIKPEYYKFEPLFFTADRAHNEFLDIQNSMGIIGFSIYFSVILLMFILFFLKKKKDSLDIALITGFLALQVSNFFGFSLTLNFLVFYTMLALLCISLMHCKQTSIRLNSINIFIIPVLLVSSFILSLIFIKNLSADIQLKKFQTNSETPYFSLIKATKLNPNQSYIYYHLAHYLQNNGVDYSETLEKAGQFEGKNWYYLINKAILEKNTDIKKSLNTLEKASLIAPKNNSILLLKGKYYYESENYFSAIRELEKILDIAPKYAFYSSNEIRRDQVGFNNFLKNNPEFSDIYETIIKAYTKTGNNSKSNYYKALKERLN